MFLYLVQHAEAKSKEEDPGRDLTDKGRADIGKVAGFLGKLDLRVGRVVHSGKARAKTTAEILAEAVKPSQGITETEGLAPLDDPGIWAEKVAKMTENAMLVGHLPHLARLAGLLLCQDREKAPVNFKMGGVVCLSRSEPGQWGLEWMLIPEIMP
ncbi:MAG: phosphohistidine phosphatase SixA [Deltaproteobacteria bacterium]|nr:phosphohistidine phosphatase SixA [Deltaproteobacteria bacterium]